MANCRSSAHKACKTTCLSTVFHTTAENDDFKNPARTPDSRLPMPIDPAQLARLTHRRWALPILAELERMQGAKFITLVQRPAPITSPCGRPWTN